MVQGLGFWSLLTAFFGVPIRKTTLTVCRVMALGATCTYGRCPGIAKCGVMYKGDPDFGSCPDGVRGM